MRFGSPSSTSNLLLRFFLLRQLLAFSDFLELRVELRQLGGIQRQLGDATLVVDRLRRLIRHGALDVVDGNVIAEHRPRVGVRLLDGRAGALTERIGSLSPVPAQTGPSRENQLEGPSLLPKPHQ